MIAECAENIARFEQIEGTSWTVLEAVAALENVWLGRPATQRERRLLIEEYRAKKRARPRSPRSQERPRLSR